MDGVQRNFSMMAEKIDRMRCLRERCDNYVRLIKLTLDETIQEQNSLLDGSAIHNRLKYLGLIDKPYKSLPNKFKNNKLHSKNIDSDYKYKHLVFDDYPGVRPLRKKTSLNTNNVDLSSNYDEYNSNYNLGIRDYSSTVYDDYNNPYYMPISSKKYGKNMNIRFPDPREYQVYYFPTSKPIPQYARHTTERFYRRKPVKQYPVEEVPYWPTRYPKPVRVIEREPSYPIFDYDYERTNDYCVSNTNIEPYTHKYRSRYIPTSDMYHSFDENNYYYESDLKQRPFSSITRPCSPVYSRDPMYYDRIHLENSGSLLEKKIRDYVWNPYKDRNEKYTSPNYEKSYYFTDFKHSPNKHRENETFRTRASFSFDDQEISRKNDVAKENVYRRNSIMTPQERKPLIDNRFQSLQVDDDNFIESIPYKKKSETPVHIPKRISFDLGNENIEMPNQTTSIGEITNENVINKDRKSVFGRKESITKIDDKRRTSLLSNDDYPISKQRVIANDKNDYSRRESFSKQEKLSSVGNSFESDKYLNLKNKPLSNDLNSVEKNLHVYSNNFKETDYNHSNNSQVITNTKNEKNNDIDKDIMSNENARNKLRRESSETEKSKLMSTTENSNFNYQDQMENISNKKYKANIERRDSYKNEQNFNLNENVSANKIKSNNLDNQVEKKYNNQLNGLNDTSKTINPLITDHDTEINNVNNYNINQQETDNLQQYINNTNEVVNENNFENTVSYPVADDSNKVTDIVNSIGQDNSNFKTITKDSEPSQDVLIDEFKNNTDYYQDHFNDDIKESLTHEYESQPEHVNDHSGNENNYYPDEAADIDKTMSRSDIEPIQQSEIINENNVQHELYYQNPTDDIKESPTKIEYENSQAQENEIDKEHPNDDYYYQNYNDGNSKEQLTNQYSELDHHGEYPSEKNEHDDYYYQNHVTDTAKEQQGDQQYVEPDYQGNYDDQQGTHDDYYYQNYDEKAQPENQYTESSNQGEYVTEHNDHDVYYDQNNIKDDTNANQPGPQYSEPVQQTENYVDGDQGNYYYENNSNVPLTDQYGEHDQQQNYAENQPMNENYYYEKHDDNYNESISKEQYDGYGDDQHQANSSYYPDSQADNYDPQQNYENNGYQQQPYEQNPNNENYDYSDNMNESENQNSTGQ